VHDIDGQLPDELMEVLLVCAPVYDAVALADPFEILGNGGASNTEKPGDLDLRHTMRHHELLSDGTFGHRKHV